MNHFVKNLIQRHKNSPFIVENRIISQNESKTVKNMPKIRRSPHRQTDNILVSLSEFILFLKLV